MFSSKEKIAKVPQTPRIPDLVNIPCMFQLHLGHTLITRNKYAGK